MLHEQTEGEGSYSLKRRHADEHQADVGHSQRTRHVPLMDTKLFQSEKDLNNM